MSQPASPPLTGTLLAIRTIQPGPSRQSVLAALGAPGPASLGTAGATEFIVAEDDGRTISVVQPDPGGFRAGSRVTLLPGGQGLLGTRIAVMLASR